MIAIYARQSKDKKDSLSIENQIERCKRLVVDDEFKIYKDKGWSGKDINRPDFERLLQDIEVGLISKVIVYKVDRLSRSILDFAKIIEKFQKHNIDFVSNTENFDTSIPMGRAMLSIILVFAQLEREQIQERIKHNYYDRAKKGFFGGGQVPFGFSRIKTKVDGKNTSKFVPDPAQMPFLIKMFEMYANTDISLGGIASILNEENITTQKGKKWDNNKISTILKNPVYVKADADIYQYYKNKGAVINNDIIDFADDNACFVIGKRKQNERKFTDLKGHELSLALHKGVIDSQTFLACQYKLDKNKQIKNSGKGKYSWLSGFAKCGYCGYSVKVTRYKENKYFNCSGKANKICEGHSKTLYVEEIEKIVKGYIIQKVSELKDTKLEISRTENSEVNKIKIQLVEIDTQIDNLVNQIAQANSVAMKYVNDKIESLDRTKKLLLEKIKKLTFNTQKIEPFEDVLKYINNWEDCSLEVKKSVCSYFINKIYITDDKIEMDWKL